MADVHVAHTHGVKLGPKLGPFPAVVWAVIVAAGLYVGYRRRQASQSTDTAASSTTDTSTSSTTDTSTSSDLGGFSGDVPIDVIGAPISSSGGSAPAATAPGAILDNGSWRIAALNALIAAGVSPIAAESAIAHYLNGDALTTTQADIINRAERAVGPPPEGVAAPSVVDNPSSSTSSGTPTAAPVVPKPRTSKRPTATNRGARKAPKPAAHHTYTVRSGDTLTAIAANLHVPGGWTALYHANAATIESAAKRHGKSSSDGGHWIFPGTVLRIPS